MRYWGLDTIICPSCKHYPLKLIIFNKTEEDIPDKNIPKPFCRTYCGYLNRPVKEGEDYPCEKCLRIEIVEGIVYCPNCMHWFPIRDGILVILPDKKRNEQHDKAFLNKYKDKIPEEILVKGKPFNLKKLAL